MRRLFYRRCFIKRASFLAVCATSTLIASALWGNSGRESGRLYIRNYGFKEYNAHQQNWAVVQDERGLIYVGNNWGVMEYDGVSWRHIATDKNSAVIALAVDSAGVIYVGAEQGLGYLAPDSSGSLQFLSLEDHIPEADRDFADVWRVHSTSYGIYFFTVKKLFLWSNHSFKVWPIDAHTYSQVVRDTLYYAEKNVGLMRVAGEAPELLPGGEKFAGERMDTMFPYADGRTLLVGTRSQGLFLYDGAAFTPFKTEADEFLKTNMIYSGTRLANGDFAFGTIRGGVAIINRKGEWLHKLDMSSGLRDQTIIFSYSDRQGALWLSFLNGLARVEITSPFSRFDAETGLESGVESIRRQKGILYATTHRGVYYMETKTPGEEGQNSFKPVSGIAAFCWSLFSDRDLLLAATDDGVYEIQGAKAKLIEPAGIQAYSFYRREQDTDHIFVGLTDGLVVLKRTSGRWINAGRIKGITVEIRSIAGDENGDLWLGTNVHGAFLVQDLDIKKPPAEKGLFEATVTKFGQDKLPVGEVNVFNIADRVVFGTERGIRTFDAKSQIFRADSTYGAVFADTVRYVGRIVGDHQNQVWIFSRKEKQRMIGYATPQSDGSFAWQPAPFRRIADVGIVFAIYPEDNGVVWIGGTEGLARYDPTIIKDYTKDFHAVLRRVTANGDSVIFGGAYPNSEGTPPFNSPLEGVSLSYAHNAMRFEFAAAFYDETPANRYRYLLEGFDEDWSNWSAETKKDYTNLPENNYRFRVRARNIYGHIGREDVFEFTILPPWYRSWLAYMAYFITFIFGLIGFTKLQVKRYQRKAEASLQMEKERANLREANLRAEAAELQASAAEAQKEKEKERMRTRIAGDLHDEIGSNLSSIAMLSQLLERNSTLQDRDRRRLRSINKVARQTALSMRDIVWFVNPVNDSLVKLFAKMRETANVMLDPVEFSFKAPQPAMSFETDLNFRRNLFLIYKESLQNIVKHAKCSRVEICMQSHGNSFALQVKDDGVGFEINKANSGNGLRNFNQRARAMMGEITIESSEGRGTRIELRVDRDGSP